MRYYNLYNIINKLSDLLLLILKKLYRKHP